MPSHTSILYWKEIPVQVKSEGADNTVSVPLDPRFQEAADAVAMMDGSYGSDSYLDAWQWGDATESELDAETAAKQLAERINRGMPGRLRSPYPRTCTTQAIASRNRALSTTG